MAEEYWPYAVKIVVVMIETESLERNFYVCLLKMSGFWTPQIKNLSHLLETSWELSRENEIRKAAVIFGCKQKLDWFSNSFWENELPKCLILEVFSFHQKPLFVVTLFFLLLFFRMTLNCSLLICLPASMKFSHRKSIVLYYRKAWKLSKQSKRPTLNPLPHTKRQGPHPGLEKHGCHDMTKHANDHAMMAAMFLDLVAMIHGMIMVWLPCFPWLLPWSWYHHFFWAKYFCQSFLSNICCRILLYGTLDWLYRKLFLHTILRLQISKI